MSLHPFIYLFDKISEVYVLDETELAHNDIMMQVIMDNSTNSMLV
jgi:hypothetical protein